MDSEFRQDLVSGDWVVISPKRFNRPEQFKKKSKRKIISKKGCPFEDPQKSGNGMPSIVYPNLKNSSAGSLRDWKIQVIENKFPIVSHKNNICAIKIKRGPFSVINGIGHHDLVISRDHYKNFAHLDKKSANLVFKVFQERYLMIAKDKCIEYIFILHNWGPKAGTSIFHPHYQIISFPIIPPDVNRSLNGSAEYFKNHGKCVHCAMLSYDRKEKKRVVFENKDAIVIVPFISREPFELRIFPKKHLPYFEKTSPKIMKNVVEALQKSLLRFEKRLNDPDYNFFIHTAPANGKYDYYHWHIEVLPKISVSAGVELGTGIEITVVDPEAAAKILR